MNMAKSTYYFEINKTDLVAIRNEELLIIIKEITLALQAYTLAHDGTEM